MRPATQGLAVVGDVDPCAIAMDAQVVAETGGECRRDLVGVVRLEDQAVPAARADGAHLVGRRLADGRRGGRRVGAVVAEHEDAAGACGAGRLLAGSVRGRGRAPAEIEARHGHVLTASRRGAEVVGTGIAVVARRCYNEPYTAVPMRHELRMADAVDGQPGRAAYAWRLGGRWHRLEVTTRGRPDFPDEGSEATFITEHYWGYTAQRDGATAEYRVAHPPWRVWAASGARLDRDVSAVYGPGFAECLALEPRSAFLAEGSVVTVYRGRALRLS